MQLVLHYFFDILFLIIIKLLRLALIRIGGNIYVKESFCQSLYP